MSTIRSLAAGYSMEPYAVAAALDLGTDYDETAVLDAATDAEYRDQLDALAVAAGSREYELQVGGVDDPEQPYVVQWQTIEPAGVAQAGDTAAAILADWRSQSGDEPTQAARVVVTDVSGEQIDSAEWWAVDGDAW